MSVHYISIISKQQIFYKVFTYTKALIKEPLFMMGFIDKIPYFNRSRVDGLWSINNGFIYLMALTVGGSPYFWSHGDVQGSSCYPVKRWGENLLGCYMLEGNFAG